MSSYGKRAEPSVGSAPSDAAGEFSEPELDRTFRALREFVHVRAVKARADLETVVAMTADSLAQLDSGPQRALAFFAREAVYKAHRPMIKVAAKDLDEAIRERSLAKAEQIVLAFVGEYTASRKYVGLAAAGASIDPDSMPHLQNWLQSDRECLMRFRELGHWPTLQGLKHMAENTPIAVDDPSWREPA